MHVDSKQTLRYIISYFNKTDKIHLTIFGSKRSNCHQSSRFFGKKNIDVKFKYDELSLIFNVKLCFFLNRAIPKLFLSVEKHLNALNCTQTRCVEEA